MAARRMSHGASNIAWQRCAQRAGRASTAKAIKIVRACAARIGERMSDAEIRRDVREMHKHVANEKRRRR